MAKLLYAQGYLLNQRMLVYLLNQQMAKLLYAQSYFLNQRMACLSIKPTVKQ